MQNEADVEVSRPPRTYISPSPQQYVSELKPAHAELALEPGALLPSTYSTYTDAPTERKPSFWRSKRGRIVLLLLAVMIVAAIIVPIVCVVVGRDEGEDRDGSGVSAGDPTGPGGAGIGTGPGTDSGGGPVLTQGGGDFGIDAPTSTVQSGVPSNSGLGIPTGTPGDTPGVI